MIHDILGKLTKSNGKPFDAIAKIQYGQRDIPVNISRDAQTLEAAIEVAADVVSQLAKLDKLAKKAASKDLLKKYNGGWNEYDEAQEDGSLKAVSNPKLSKAQFEAKLSLKAINVAGDSSIDFIYDDEGMFWGHSVAVNVESVADFANAFVELWG